jgi:hypothetical protein
VVLEVAFLELEKRRSCESCCCCYSCRGCEATRYGGVHVLSSDCSSFFPVDKIGGSDEDIASCVRVCNVVRQYLAQSISSHTPSKLAIFTRKCVIEVGIVCYRRLDDGIQFDNLPTPRLPRSKVHTESVQSTTYEPHVNPTCIYVGISPL